MHDAGTGDALGRTGDGPADPLRDRRAARFLYHPDQLRLASPDRRRYRDPGDWTPAGSNCPPARVRWCWPKWMAPPIELAFESKADVPRDLGASERRASRC